MLMQEAGLVLGTITRVEAPVWPEGHEVSTQLTVRVFPEDLEPGRLESILKGRAALRAWGEVCLDQGVTPGLAGVADPLQEAGRVDRVLEALFTRTLIARTMSMKAIGEGNLVEITGDDAEELAIVADVDPVITDVGRRVLEDAIQYYDEHTGEVWLGRQEGALKPSYGPEVKVDPDSLTISGPRLRRV